MEPFFDLASVSSTYSKSSLSEAVRTALRKLTLRTACRSLQASSTVAPSGAEMSAPFSSRKRANSPCSIILPSMADQVAHSMERVSRIWAWCFRRCAWAGAW